MWMDKNVYFNIFQDMNRDRKKVYYRTARAPNEDQNPATILYNSIVGCYQPVS